MGFFSDRLEAKALRILQAGVGPDVEIFQQVSCAFRTNMGGTSQDWRKGFCAISQQGLHAWESRGGLFTQDWGTIRYLNGHLGDYTSGLSAVGFSGEILQVIPDMDSSQFINRSLAAWSLLQPASIEAGGVEMDFTPGTWEKPAVHGIDRQWSGGDLQLLGFVEEWAKTITSRLELTTIDNAIAGLLPDLGDDKEKKWRFWDERARAVVKGELGLTNRQMAEVDVVSTRGAFITPQSEPLNEIWLAIVNATELWTIYFPAFDPLFRPTAGPDYVSLPNFSNRDLPFTTPDLVPGSMTRYSIADVAAIQTSDYKDCRGPLIIHDEGKGVIQSTIPLKNTMYYGITGEYGCEVFRTVLQAARPDIEPAY